MQKQAEHMGTKIVTDHVSKVELAQRPFHVARGARDVGGAIARRHGIGARDPLLQGLERVDDDVFRRVDFRAAQRPDAALRERDRRQVRVRRRANALARRNAKRELALAAGTS